MSDVKLDIMNKSHSDGHNQITRQVTKTGLKALRSFPCPFIQVFVGPRQVGKTTAAQQILKQINDQNIDGKIVTADGPHIDHAYLETWLKVAINKASKAPYLLVIDEIHKVKDWSEVIKIFWDQRNRKQLPLNLLILGSSQIMLDAGVSESLAGRIEKHYFTHWSYSEIKEAFNISVDDYIYWGGYPGAYQIIDDEIRWKQYIRSSLIDSILMNDIMTLKNIAKPALMKNCFELACLYSGKELSFNKMLGQLQDVGNITTLSNYLYVLEQGSLVCGLYKYSASLVRQRKSSPKFQVFNNAFLSALSSQSKDKVMSTPDIWGRWVESAVGTHLLSVCQNSQYELTYWRRDNVEIDFILYDNKNIWLIEVKSGKKKKYKANGFKVFQREFGCSAISIIVGSGGMELIDFFSGDGFL